MSFKEIEMSGIFGEHSNNIKSGAQCLGETLNFIGKDWMLIASGDEKKYNMMTASWGGFGVLWNKNVAFSFIRPQRYTKEFIDSNDYYTLSFYEHDHKDALAFCGKVSGRDKDKMLYSGLTALFNYNTVYFSEAALVIVCKKIYSQNLTPESFIDRGIDDNYPNKDYHEMYIGEIVKVLAKEE